GQQPLEPGGQPRVVACGGVGEPALLAERDRALGQALEHDVGEPAPLGELHRGLEPVAREPGARPDPDRPAHAIAPVPSATAVMTSVVPNAQPNTNRWWAPSCTPAIPTRMNVEAVSGLSGNPVVIWPRMAARATSAGSPPSAAEVSASTGSTPK